MTVRSLDRKAADDLLHSCKLVSMNATQFGGAIVGAAELTHLGAISLPVVSIVIPCFNQAQFLADAIRSVDSQSFRNFEIIVVDDGSADNSAEVARSFPDVRCISQHNRGLSGARNAGMAESRGHFLVFLDADDRLGPLALEAGLACFRAHPAAGFVYGAHSHIAFDGAFVSPGPNRRAYRQHYKAFLRGNFLAIHAVMFRSEVVKSAGGFDEALTSCEDYDLYMRIARDHQVASHDLVIAEYRRHDANMSNRLEYMLAIQLRVLRKQKPFAKRSRDLWRAYRDGIRAARHRYGRELLKDLVCRAKTGKAYLPRPSQVLFLARNAPKKELLNSLIWRILSQHRDASAFSRICQRTFLRLPFIRVSFGDLRRITPITRDFGYSRGLPVDRYYVEDFLQRHTRDIFGRVLEIGDNEYTLCYGGEHVDRSDILDVTKDNPKATIIGDLVNADHIPSDAFDCIILTQTLHFVFSFSAAVTTLFRILRPGGVLLATFPGISHIPQRDPWCSTWYWSFTPLSARRLFSAYCPETAISVESHGNVLAATAFLHGLAARELSEDELDHEDLEYPVLVAVRAAKLEHRA